MAIWAQADIDELKAAVRSGVLSVTYSGPPSRTVQYQNLKEMRALLAEMIADVAGAAGTGRPYRVFSTKKGF